MSCLRRFHVTIVWLPLLLGCFFTMCESQGSSNVFSNSQQTYGGSSNESGKSALSQPGVVVGIIVGVAGVLVVVGVSILLCRLFCCKDSTACCCCCKEEETYLEAGAVPIKVPSEDGTPDSNVTRTRQTQNNTRKTSDSSPNPPQYDDILVPDGKLDNVMKNKLPKTSDGEERESQDFLHNAVPQSENSATLPADGDETANNHFSSGATKRKKPTPTRRKLTYEAAAENPDLTQDSADFASALEHHRRPKKHDRREFPVTGHRHRKDNPKTPQHEDATVERNADEMTSGREFPLLEYEPGARKVRNFSYNPPYADVSRDTWEGYGNQGGEFRPVEFDHQHQYLPAASHYPDHSSSRVRGEERRPWEHRETFAPHAAPAPLNNSNPPHHNVPYISGRVNPAYNQDSAETEV